MAAKYVSSIMSSAIVRRRSVATTRLRQTANCIILKLRMTGVIVRSPRKDVLHVQRKKSYLVLTSIASLSHARDAISYAGDRKIFSACPFAGSVGMSSNAV